MNSPIVSIIVPVYNVSEYVDACIVSIIRQTYSDFELILVDDGSTDESGNVCEQWAAKDSRIQVIHKSNGGLSDARNAGLDIARGRYICFVDGDDSIEPQLLATTIPYMEQGFDLVRYRYEFQGSSQKAVFQTLPDTFHFDNQADIGRFILQYYLTYKINYEIWSGIYRADIIRSHNLRFVDNKKIFSEDICFFLYYLVYCANVKMLNRKLYHYTIRDNSIMSHDRSTLNAGRISLLGEMVYTYYSTIHANDLLRAFPAIYFLLIDIQVAMYLHNNPSTDILSIRQPLMVSIPNLPFFKRQMRAMYRMRRFLSYAYATPLSQWEKISTAYYYLIGNQFLYRLCNKLIYFRFQRQ